jgi:hypothetical protein
MTVVAEVLAAVAAVVVCIQCVTALCWHPQCCCTLLLALLWQ